MQANPHDDARSSRCRPYKNVSRETFLSDRRRKSYKPQDKRFVFDLVGTADFFCAIEHGLPGASMAASSDQCHPMCKFGEY